MPIFPSTTFIDFEKIALFQRHTGFDLGIESQDEKQIIEEQLKNLDKEIQLRGSELGDIQKNAQKLIRMNSVNNYGMLYEILQKQR